MKDWHWVVSGIIVVILLVALLGVIAGCSNGAVLDYNRGSDKTLISYANVSYNIGCVDICGSHHYKTLGDSTLFYHNQVCFCGDSDGQIWSFVMGEMGNVRCKKKM